VNKLNLAEDCFLTLDQSEAEGYLLDTAAILAAFPREIRLTPEELEERLAPYRTRRNQKQILDILFQQAGLGKYNGLLGAKIARAMRTVPAVVASFFQDIKAKLQRMDQ